MELCTVGLLVIILILTFLYMSMKRAHEFFKRHGIAGPQPARMFGTFSEYRKKGLLQTDMDLISKYGNVVGIYHGHMPVLLVADPEMIEAICIKHFDKFRNRKINLDLGSLLRKTVALSNDGQWRFLRDQISEVFKPIYLKKISGNLLQSTNHLISNIEDKLKNETDFDFQELCLCFSVDSMCNSLFSHNINSYKDKEDKIVNMIRKGWSAGTVGIARPALACAICPLMATMFSIFHYNAIPSDVREFFSQVVTSNMLKRHTDGEQNDLLSFIMKTTRRNSTVECQNNTARTINNVSSEYKLSETEMVANCLFFFLAGYDTTASTVVFTLYCLAKNQDCQEQLVKEIQNNISDTLDDVDKLEYLDMVINESLRIFPTYLRFSRCVQEDIVIKGTKFCKGTEVSFPVYAIHRNPEYFPDPEKFDPNRFSYLNTSKRNPFSFIPFGVGQRDCFAQTYAKITVKTAVVALLQKFRFSLSKKQMDPPPLSKGFYLRPENGLWLTVEKRTGDQDVLEL